MFCHKISYKVRRNIRHFTRANLLIRFRLNWLYRFHFKITIFKIFLRQFFINTPLLLYTRDKRSE